MSRSWAAALPACTRRGCWRCAGAGSALVERRRIGWGASGRNGGFVGAGFAQRSARADRTARAGPCAPALRPVAARRRDRARGHRRAGPARHPHGQRASSRSRAPTRARASPSARARWRKSSAPASSRGRPRGCAPCSPPRATTRRSTIRSRFTSIRSISRWRWPATSSDAAARVHERSEAVGLERAGRRLAPADGRRRDRGAPCRAGRQRRSRPRAAAHRARRAAGGDLCRGDGQDRPAARRGHPLEGRDLRHAPRRRLLPHRRRRPPAVGRPHHHRHARAAAPARDDARRHPLGLSAARRHQDRLCLARHHGLRAAQDAPGRRDRARPVGLLGVRRPRACPDGGRCRCCRRRYRRRRRPLEAVPPFGTRWAGGPLGRIATQLIYWRLQASDWWDEKRQAENAEKLRT